MSEEKIIECSPGKKRKDLYNIHVLIGAAIVALFWIIPPIDPITKLGMRCVGTFLGMIYWWSLVDTMWPSIVGLFLFGMSGYAEGGMNAVWLNAIGNYTVLLTLFAMVLFGAVSEVGDTDYIARWFLTKKIFKGRPYVFIMVFYACCMVLSALVSPISELIILWPIALGLMKNMGVDRCDKVWSWFFVGMFLCSTLMQPFFPFQGAQLVPISAFAAMTAAIGNPMEIPMLPYMAVNLIMSVLIMAVYLLIMRFVIRVDMSKMASIDPEMVEKQMDLPPMNFQQKSFLIMIPIYLVAVIWPSFSNADPIGALLNQMGILGITVAFLSFFVIFRWNGKPLLNFKDVAYKQMNWGIFFMIAAAVYGANSLSNANCGVTEFLVRTLNPVLGGQSEQGFVLIMFLVALVITNFANNAAMAVVLLPVAVTFCGQLGINPIPVMMGIILMVFVAMLTPSASPHGSMMHGRKDIYSTGEILKIGLPMCIITWLLYSFVGYRLCKLLLAAFGIL